MGFRFEFSGAAALNGICEYLYILLLSLRRFEPKVSKLYLTNLHKMYKYPPYMFNAAAPSFLKQ